MVKQKYVREDVLNAVFEICYSEELSLKQRF